MRFIGERIGVYFSVRNKAKGTTCAYVKPSGVDLLFFALMAFRWFGKTLAYTQVIRRHHMCSLFLQAILFELDSVCRINFFKMYYRHND